MIDEAVEQYAIRAASFIQHLAGGSFHYTPNFSLDSLVLLDFLFDERFKSQRATTSIGNIPEESAQVLAASYTALCIYRIWEKSLSHCKISCVLSDEEDEVILKIQKAPEVLSPITIKLVDLLSQNSLSFNYEYARNQKIPLDLGRYRCLFLAWGILSGTHPSIETISATQWYLDYLENMTEEIAGTTLSRLVAREPSISDIIKPDFAKKALCFPPIGYDEQFPGSRAVSHLHTMYEGDTHRVKRLALHLLEYPNPQWSALAFIILVGLQDENSEYFLNEFCIHFPLLSQQLRPAILVFRGMFAEQRDWVTPALRGDVGAAKDLVSFDHKIGLSNIVIHFDHSVFQTPSTRNYLEILDTEFLEPAYHLGISLLEKESNPLISLQHTKVCLELSKHEEAAKAIMSVDPSLLSEEGKNCYDLLSAQVSKQKTQILDSLKSEKVSDFNKKTLLLHSYIHQVISIEDLARNTIPCLITDYCLSLEDKEISQKSTDKLQRLYWSPYLFWTRVHKKTKEAISE